MSIAKGDIHKEPYKSTNPLRKIPAIKVDWHLHLTCAHCHCSTQLHPCPACRDKRVHMQLLGAGGRLGAGGERSHTVLSVCTLQSHRLAPRCCWVAAAAAAGVMPDDVEAHSFLCAEEPKQRALVDSVLHWHHTMVRQVLPPDKHVSTSKPAARDPRHSAQVH